MKSYLGKRVFFREEYLFERPVDTLYEALHPDLFQWSRYLPVFRHFPQPLHSGGLEPDVGVQAPRDGLVDQCLPLLLQQGDEPLLACDVALDLLVGVVDGTGRMAVLFFWMWRNREWSIA